MVHIRDFLDFLAMRADTRASRRRKPAEDGPSEPPGSGPRSGPRSGQSLGPSLGRVDLSVSLAQAKILRPVLFVPRSMPAIDLLVRMQATRTHMALVIDEYGGTDGLVSIEDLVEMVVGDIEDEHDDATASMIVRSEDDTFMADARASLDEVKESLGIDLNDEDSAEDIDTLGGFIVTLAGRVPSRGELIAGPESLEFEVLDADPRRIKRVRIHRREMAARAPRTGAEDAAPAHLPVPPDRLPPPESAAAE
jgi:CBS domain containing-hemolysin-like protein